VPTLGTPVKTLPPEPFTARPPARLGEHTDAILGDLPGYDPARIKALREARAIA
jgi:formyl-CoA transferase